MPDVFIYITLIFPANLKHKYNNYDFRDKEIEKLREVKQFA